MERWENLEIWKLADDLALRLYLVTKGFPKDELYGITSQLRRAALSVPSNIVEGYSRKGDKELSRFINISLGSLAETKYLLKFAKKLALLDENDYEELSRGYEELGRKLWKFYEAVRS
ncbi:MAG: four helix bundle protein [Deltaproteobacteria bacterium]|nr:four helix bundle protein [Deltaproteobacteria bacterium]MBW1929186.1 four helix bundle protein [Deltaproteobacteria bacterium]RLB17462.1 MAG: four helix bundle protein [Deltaproteobacteria bacterium]